MRGEALAAARVAEVVGAVARQQHAHVHLVGARLEPLEPGAHARVTCPPVQVPSPSKTTPRCSARELAPRLVERDALPLAELHERAALPLGRGAGPGPDRAALEGSRLVGDHLVPVDADGAAEAAALGAGAGRRLVREEPDPRRLEGARAHRAGEARAPTLSVRLGRAVAVRRTWTARRAAGAAPGLLDGGAEAAARRALHELDAIDHHLDAVAAPSSASLRLELVEVARLAPHQEAPVAARRGALAHLEVRLGAATGTR